MIIYPVTILNEGVSLDPNLVAQWKFDENTGSETRDIVANRIITFPSGIGWTSSGKFDNALDADGFGTYGLLSGTLSIDVPHSICFWIYPKSLTNLDGFWVSTQTFSEVRFNSASNGLQVTVLGGSLIRTGIPVINTWNHIVLVKEEVSGLYKLYHNSTYLEWSNSGIFPSNLNSFNSLRGVCFGGNPPPAFNRVLDGYMDDMRIYSKVLTPAEVSGIYNGDI